MCTFRIHRTVGPMGLPASELTRVPTIGYNPTVDVNMTRGLLHKVRELTRDNIFKATPN
jgi:hypothetical protein